MVTVERPSARGIDRDGDARAVRGHVEGRGAADGTGPPPAPEVACLQPSRRGARASRNAAQTSSRGAAIVFETLTSNPRVV